MRWQWASFGVLMFPTYWKICLRVEDCVAVEAASEGTEGG